MREGSTVEAPLAKAALTEGAAAKKTSGAEQDADKMKILSNLPPEKVRIKSRLLEYLLGW